MNHDKSRIQIKLYGPTNEKIFHAEIPVGEAMPPHQAKIVCQALSQTLAEQIKQKKTADSEARP